MYKTQKQWLKDRNINVGDMVIVASKAVSMEDGWCGSWNPDMDACIGKAYPVKKILEDEDCQYGVMLTTECGDYLFPHFVLVKEEKDEPVVVEIETEIATVEFVFDNGVIAGVYNWISPKFAQFYNNGHLVDSNGYAFSSSNHPAFDGRTIYLPGRGDNYCEFKREGNIEDFTAICEAHTLALEWLSKKVKPTVEIEDYEVEFRSDGLKWKGIIISDTALSALYALRKE